MLESLKTPWWRLPLILMVGGVVLIVLDLLVRLGWIPFLIGLAAMVYAGYRFARGQASGGPRLLLAACAGGVILIAGLVWLHPQSWLQPGWKLPRSAGTIVGRAGNVAVFEHGHHYSGRSLDAGQLIWSAHYRRPVSVVGNWVLVQSYSDPTKARAYIARTGEFDRVVPWAEPRAEATGVPTPAQRALFPKLSSGEHVREQVRDNADAARIVEAVDATGHHYTRVDVLVGENVSQYRVSARHLTFVSQILVIRGHGKSRVVPLIQGQPGSTGTPSPSNDPL